MQEFNRVKSPPESDAHTEGGEARPSAERSVLDDLLQKIETRTARVGVIGLGYVGLPLALLFEESGFPVLGFDIDEQKTDALNDGQSYIRHIGTERIRAAFRRRARATSADETGTTRSMALSYSLTATSSDVASMAPTTFGIVFVLKRSLPGSSRSGENARK